MEKKFYFFNKAFLYKNIKKIIIGKRSWSIIREMLNLIIKIHNGIYYKIIKITPLMIGKKLGEFYDTRKRSSILFEKKKK